MKLWNPTDSYIRESAMTSYKIFLEEKYALSFGNYHDLWEWSINNLETFWGSIMLFFEIQFEGSYDKIMVQPEANFIGTKWFEGIKLNYAEHIFRNYNDDKSAIIYQGESEETKHISWKLLRQQTYGIQQYLLKSGVKSGDFVAGVLNNTPETIAIFLAVNSIGAIWTCCSPDLGAKSILERLEQVSPKILFMDKSYVYNGKAYSKKDLIKQLSNSLESVDDVMVVNDLKWRSIMAISKTSKDLKFQKVPFHHPLWVLFSSGTTGKPKAIVHSSGGNLLEHFKALGLHQNVQKGERFMWYSTTGWMMWNYALASMLQGVTLCIYNGSPSFPDLGVLWNFAKENKIDHFGAGAAFYIACENLNLELPALSLKTLGSTGSPLPAETFKFLQRSLPNTQIISLSGGTDVCSAFLSGCPWLPVYAGEIQCRTLGADIEAIDDNGKSVIDELGELIISQPMPSMPVYFLNDPNDDKFRNSYFNKFPDKWYHGDWIKITKNDGVIIFGRSDATLNRGGVRIGTAEIYNGISNISEIMDSLVVSIENKDGSSKMLLFLKLKEGFTLNKYIEETVKSSLRTNYTPRHIPDAIFQVPDIPYTLSGKKLELPVKRLLMGNSLEKSVSIEAVKNPESLDFWVNFKV